MSETIELPATAEAIGQLDRWVADRARGHGLADALAEALRTCAAEVASNIVEHALAGRERAVFSVRLEIGKDVRLEVADDGPPFDPAAYPLPPMPSSIETAPIGGVGIRLMRGFSRAMSYRRVNARNVLTLAFDRDPTPAG